MTQAQELIHEYESKRDKARQYVQDAAQHFIDKKGEFVEQSKAVETLSDNFSVEEAVAEQIITELVNDIVDPVQSIDEHIGVVEYNEREHAYEYIHYDDIDGKRKTSVCAHCVDEVDRDRDVSYARAGEGSLNQSADWDTIRERIRSHVVSEHPEAVENTGDMDVEVGAKLLSGTTIGGNEVSPDSNSSAHHSKYTDSDAQNAVSTFSGSHNDLNNVGSSDHHSKYTDSDAISAVGASTPFANGDLSNSSVTIEGNSVSLGGSTSVNHNDLSNISSDDHHSKYTDSDARSAVSTFSGSHNDLNNVGSSDHHSKTSSASELSDVSADSNSSAHHSKYTDSDARSAVSTFSGSHNDLSNVGSSDHHSKYTDSDAQNAVSTFSGSHNDLSNVGSSDHHSKYTDSNARSAVDGANVDISGDSDTVDGFDANDLARPKNICILSSDDTSTDINKNSWTKIPWTIEQQVDADYTHDAVNSPEEITFDVGGTYKVFTSISYDTSDLRQNPGIRFAINGSRRNATGLSGYSRHADGHYEASNTIEEYITVNSGDTLTVQTSEFGNYGSVTLRANESVLNIEQVSETVAHSGDADTVDGKHATDFATDNHDNSQHSTNYLPESDYNPQSDTSYNSFSGSHNDLSNVGSSDHHSKYTDSDARSAVNTFSGSHNDLSNVGSSDHHSKTSSASELTDVSPDSTSNAHHSKYTDTDAQNAVSTFSGSHNDLSNVGSSDHHSKYTDNDAQNAVDNSSVNVDSVDGYDIQKNGTDGNGIINFKT